MPVWLDTLESIARHLTARGFEVMIAGPRVAVRARVADFNAHVCLQFLSTRRLRVDVSMPVRVTDANRSVFALHALRLNRTGLGVGCILGRQGLVFATYIPVEEPWRVSAIVVERALALVVEHSSAALPALERIHHRGLAGV